MHGLIGHRAPGEFDVAQVDAALARCEAKLYAPENNVPDDPRPISREDFHKLLAGCGTR
jgi:hypothetical protein